MIALAVHDCISGHDGASFRAIHHFPKALKAYTDECKGYFIGFLAIREILSKGINGFPRVIEYGMLLLDAILVLVSLGRLIWPKKPNEARQIAPRC